MNLEALKAAASHSDEASFVAAHPQAVLLVRRAVLPAPPKGDEIDDWRTQTQRLPQMKVGPAAAENPFSLLQLATVEPLVKSDRNPFDGMITIGRAPNNDICLPAASVSKLHAYFFAEQGEWCLRDSGSANGTFVNGVHLAAGSVVRLTDGAHIRFGSDADVLFKLPAGLFHFLRKAKTP